MGKRQRERKRNRLPKEALIEKDMNKKQDIEGVNWRNKEEHVSKLSKLLPFYIYTIKLD